MAVEHVTDFKSAKLRTTQQMLSLYAKWHVELLRTRGTNFQLSLHSEAIPVPGLEMRLPVDAVLPFRVETVFVIVSGSHGWTDRRNHFLSQLINSKTV